MAVKTKSLKQVRFLLSKGTPLTKKQRLKLLQELHTKQVRIVKRKRK
jgi:hypothetical protein